MAFFCLVRTRKAYMITTTRIKEEFDLILLGLQKRGLDLRSELEEILEQDDVRKRTQKELDDTLHEARILSKEIGGLFKAGKKEEAEQAKSRTSALKAQEKVLHQKLAETEEALTEKLRHIPNVPHESVPKGTSESDNVETERWGEAEGSGEQHKPHWELAKTYGLIDFEAGVKITGAGFPVYTGKGAILQRALINFFLDRNVAAGYQEVLPPHFVNEDSAYGTGQLPDKEGQMYHITADDLYCIPTAEVPVTNLYRGDILKEEDLPKRNTAYTPCFRREAGSYGKDVRGLNRLHQFDKVEVVVVEHPDRSYERLDRMVEHIGGLIKELEIPHRILRLCGGDLGFTSALTYDFEVWSRAQERWLEVSSVSNFESFQSNRLKLRYRPSDGGKPQLCHTLNGSALALPRILAALLENNQTESGIVVPKVLQPYTHFDLIQ